MAWTWTTIGINVKRAQQQASTILDLSKPIQSLSTSIEDEYLKRWFQIRSYLEFESERFNGREWFMIWELLVPKSKMRRPNDKIWRRWSEHADWEIKQELMKEASQGEAYQTEPYYNRFRDQQDTWMLDMQEELKATDADLFAFKFGS